MDSGQKGSLKMGGRHANWSDRTGTAVNVGWKNFGGSVFRLKVVWEYVAIMQGAYFYWFSPGLIHFAWA